MGIDELGFHAKSLIQDGVIRQLEIIGEAVKRISAATRNISPQIPWPAIARMRDKLISDYFGVNLDLRFAGTMPRGHRKLVLSVDRPATCRASWSNPRAGPQNDVVSPQVACLSAAVRRQLQGKKTAGFRHGRAYGRQQQQPKAHVAPLRQTESNPQQHSLTATLRTQDVHAAGAQHIQVCLELGHQDGIK